MLRLTRAAFVVLGLGIFGGTGAEAQPTQQSARKAPTGGGGPRYSAEERRAAGEAILKEEVRVYGVVEDPVWQPAIAGILNRLRYSTADPNLELRPVIVGNPEINAGAIPGGIMMINAGLLGWVDSLARLEEPNDTARRRERSWAYVAAMLAHETAHITLLHTDDIIDAMTRRVRQSSGNRQVPGVGFERESRFNADTVAALYRQRGLEQSADSLGALYLLRAGWEIQNMMDLFRQFEAGEGPQERLLATYVRTHPRSSTREALLESLRGRLKLNQGRLDDAVALINTNTELSLAVALLDSVLTDFPALLAAQEARAAAYHRMWLNTVSVRSQEVRGSLYTYSAQLLPAIRGAGGIPGDSVLHARARAGYQAVLRRMELPGALSNLALLDAYAGRSGIALQEAGRAVQLVQDDPQLLNNLGVVRFLSGDRTGALDAFKRSLALMGSDEDPAVVFNLGKTQALLRDPAARATLQGYLAFKEPSVWEKEAAELLGATAPAREAPGVEANPPAIQGVQLGMTSRDVERILGSPERTEEWAQPGTKVLRGWILHYPSLGLNLGIGVADKEEAAITGGRIRFIALLRTETGDVDGVRVGTPLSEVRARWGWPAERQPNFLLFSRGSWLAGTEYADPQGPVMRLYVIASEKP